MTYPPYSDEDARAIDRDYEGKRRKAERLRAEIRKLTIRLAVNSADSHRRWYREDKERLGRLRKELEEAEDTGD